MYVFDSNVSTSSSDSHYGLPYPNPRNFHCKHVNRVPETMVIRNMAEIQDKSQPFYVLPNCKIDVRLEVNAIIESLNFVDLQIKINQLLFQMKNISDWGIVYDESFNEKFKTCKEGIDYTLEMFEHKIPELLACFFGQYIWKNIIGQNFNLIFESTTSLTQIKYFMGYEVDSLDFTVEFPPDEINFVACGDTFKSTKVLH